MTVTLISGGGEEHEGGLGEFILHHLQDSREWLGAQLPAFQPVNILGMQLDFSITLHVVMIWLAGAFLILTFWLTFRKPELVPRGFAGVLESMVLFIRDEIAVPNIGEKLGKKLTPFLCSLFFFILTCNLLGLIPLFSTATSNLNVTAALAVVAFVMTQLQGMKENGVLGYWKHLVPGGVPWFLLPIMLPIEILGLFTKPFALAMRLFANMIAGHTVIYALLGLIIVLGTYFVAPVSIAFAVAINLLELFVAFLQAYIFTMLTSLFIGMAAHPSH
jgi:F-type H+-transporting ATPase subunit a